MVANFRPACQQTGTPRRMEGKPQETGHRSRRTPLGKGSATPSIWPPRFVEAGQAATDSALFWPPRAGRSRVAPRDVIG